MVNAVTNKHRVLGELRRVDILAEREKAKQILEG